MGRPEYAQAFLQSGCRAYIGAVDAESGNSSLFYILHFCYDWLCRQMSLEDAHASAASHDDGTRLFKLYMNKNE
jgi:hypothetical protein